MEKSSKGIKDIVNRLAREYGMQFIRFGCVGVCNTAIDYAVYWISNQLLGEEILLGSKNYLIAQLFGFVAGTLNAYFLNGKFVFSGENRQRNKGKRQLIRSFIGYGVTFALSECMLWVLVSRVNLNKYLSKLLIMCLTIPLNFVINRFWTFKNIAEEK